MIEPNGLRYRGSGDHVESYFIKATAPDARRAIWLKATVLASAREPERAVAEGWAIAFDQRDAPRHLAVKHTVPYDHASFHPDRLAIDWVSAAGDGVRIAAGSTSGSIRHGGRRIAWELTLAGDDRPLELLPYRWMYRAPLPSTKTITPVPDAIARGWVDVDGQEWALDGWRAMQGHNWGRRQGEYGWLHCNAFDVDGLVIEAGSSRQRLGPLQTPYLTSVVVRHRGADHAFSVPRSLWSSHADVAIRSYAFSASGPNGRVEALVDAPAEHFVALRYDNPSGPPVTCLNAKLARARVRFEPSGGAPIEARSHAAALEITTTRGDHGVPIHV